MTDGELRDGAITADFLATAGFVGPDDRDWRWHRRVGPVRVVVGLFDDGTTSVSVGDPERLVVLPQGATPNSVGRLRLLCRAVGVPLEEPE